MRFLRFSTLCAGCLHLAIASGDDLDPTADCIFSPDFAAAHRCMGINRSDVLDPSELACRKLQCMSCAALEESMDCKSYWQDACKWGLDALNRPICEASCRFQDCEQFCWKSHGWDYEPFRCHTEITEYGGYCGIECRKKCNDEIRQLPSGEWYCCENDSYFERNVKTQRFATCEGFALPVFQHSEPCAHCAVHCDGMRYGVCNWKSWVINDESSGVRASPAALVFLVIFVVGSVMSCRTLLFVFLLAVFSHGLDIQILEPGSKVNKTVQIGQEPFPQQCLLQHPSNAVQKFLHPFAQSSLHSELLGTMPANISAWTQFTIQTHQILAAARVNGGIDLWQIGPFDLVPAMNPIEDLGTTPAKVLAAFHNPTQARSAHLAAGYADGSLRVWQLDAARLVSPVRISAQLQFTDTSSHSGHQISALLMVPFAEGLIVTGGFDRRLVFRSINDFSNVVAEFAGFAWPPIALAWVGTEAGVLAVAGDYDVVSFLRPFTYDDGCVGWTRVGQSKSMLSPSFSGMPPRVHNLISLPGAAVVASTDIGFRILLQNGTAVLAWDGKVLGGPFWIAGADVLGVLFDSPDDPKITFFQWSGFQALQYPAELHIPLTTQVQRRPVLFVDPPSELLLVGGKSIDLVKLIARVCDRGSLPHTSHKFCTPCVPGKAGFAEPGECRDCTPGKYQPDDGMESCHECPPGRFSDEKAAQSCSSCPAGRFSSTSGCTRCDGVCPPGQESDGTSCQLCPRGRAGQGGVCHACPRWQLATKYGLASCSEFCPPGDFPAANRTVCMSFTPGTDPAVWTWSPWFKGIVGLTMMALAFGFYRKVKRLISRMQPPP